MSHFSRTELFEQLIENVSSPREREELRSGWDAFLQQLHALEDGEVLNCEMLGSFYRSNGKLSFRPASVLRKEINHRYEGQRPIVLAEGYQAGPRKPEATPAPQHNVEELPEPSAEKEEDVSATAETKEHQPSADLPADSEQPAGPEQETTGEPAGSLTTPEAAAAEVHEVEKTTPAAPPNSMITPGAASEPHARRATPPSVFSGKSPTEPGEMPLNYKIAGLIIVLLLLSGMGYLILNYSIYGGYNAAIAAEEADTEQSERPPQNLNETPDETLPESVNETPAETPVSTENTEALVNSAPAPFALPDSLLYAFASNEANLPQQLPLPRSAAPPDTSVSELENPLEVVGTPGFSDAESLRVADVAPTIDLSDSLVPVGEYGLRGSMQRVRGDSFGIVVHSLGSRRRAIEQDAALNVQGFRTITYPVQKDDGSQTWRVSVGQFPSVEAAQQAVEELPEAYRSSFFIARFTP